MRCYQLARTVACDDIKHLRVPFLCSDDLWRFVSALDASVHFWRGKWTFGLGVLTNTGSEMAYELQAPSSTLQMGPNAYFFAGRLLVLETTVPLEPMPLKIGKASRT